MPTTPIISSAFFKLDLRDAAKAAIVAVLSAVLPLIYDVLVNGGKIDWVTVKNVGIAAFVGYIIKNLLGSKEVIIKGLNESQTSSLKTGISSLKLVDAKRAV